jgi:monoterpene epsilon-lactone hydrolase
MTLRSSLDLRALIGAICVAGVAAFAPGAIAQPASNGGFEVPTRSLPVPDTVSPQVQKLIAAPLRPGWNVLPKTGEEWKPVSEAGAAGTIRNLPGLTERLKVKIEKTTIDGVRAFIVTPETIAPENRERVLIHMHGGCYVLNGGEAGLPEAMLMAAFGRAKVISVDYRMPPDHPYPAALDDAMSAWKAATKMASPKNMAIFGSSAGGNLTLAMVLRAKQDKLPLPAAIAPGTPMSDLTNAGDSFHTNAILDNVLVASGANCDKRAALYTAGRDPKDPLLSPVYGDLSGFPPAILTTGTRDLLLSSTVRVHRKLRQAGVEAVLQVYEGQSHAHYYRDVSAPETREAFTEIAQFFDRHLGK